MYVYLLAYMKLIFFQIQFYTYGGTEWHGYYKYIPLLRIF